ncbi:MAG: hypothetical protein SD837_04175 [Candidatus Electrothrix scaldis]|nr:MAG: hypothetical protein SD837_04175 [Candidatus Electrothrix sp. GW3-3]
MKIGKFLEATILYTAPDGRVYFRPWGRKGSCYLVGTVDRKKFTWFVRVYYTLFFIITLLPLVGGLQALYIGLGVWTLIFYVAFWFLSRGLPIVDPPATPTPEQREAALSNLSSSLGKPFLWILLSLSVLMAFGAAATIIFGNVILGIIGLLLFGGSSMLFWGLLKKVK